MADIKLIYAIACDDAKIDAAGKGVFTGVFDRILTAGAPTMHSKFSFVVNIAGTAGTYLETVELINKLDNKVVAKLEAEVQIKPKGRAGLVSTFSNIIFPTLGEYWFKVSVAEQILTQPDIHYVAVEKVSK